MERTFPVELSASCLDSRGKRTYTLIVRDISERKRVELELKAQAESLARAMTELKALNDELAERQLELERAMAARSRFYASMSHELRTPINAVLGYSTLLLENIYGPLNEKQTEGITRTHKAAKHLLELVNDVLDLSKIEAGKIDLRLQPVAFPRSSRTCSSRAAARRPVRIVSSPSSTRGAAEGVSDPRRCGRFCSTSVERIKFGAASRFACGRCSARTVDSCWR
jgi:signal transduction histidine kinase